MIVPYTRFLSFLVNGLDNTYRDNLYEIKDNLEFTFSEYVLSQMHLAVVSHLLKRDLYVIYRVYRFIEEARPVDRKDLVTVLQWFYHDMAKFFRNIAECNLLKEIILEVIVPVDVFTSLGIEAEELSFAAEKKLVLEAMEIGNGKYESEFDFDYMDTYKDRNTFKTEEQENRFVMAAILGYCSKQDKYIRWCNDDHSSNTFG